MRAEQRQRERLRESTNTRSASQQQQQQLQHGAGGGGVGCQPGSSPPGGQVQYYALSQRGGAAQPLSDMDFVHALLGDRSSGGGGVSSGQQPPHARVVCRRRRSASSARESSSGHYGRGGAQAVAAAPSAREHSMKDMHSAYAKPRGSSAYARSARQRGGRRGEAESFERTGGGGAKEEGRGEDPCEGAATVFARSHAVVYA